MDDIEYVLNKHNCIKRINTPSTTLKVIEEFVYFKLPDDYRKFLIDYQGFEKAFGKEYMQLWDIDNLLENNDGYEIQKYMEQFIGIGSNMGGELIALELINENVYKIILAPFICFQDKQDHIEIGSSFTDFLLRLDREQEWFI